MSSPGVPPPGLPHARNVALPFDEASDDLPPRRRVFQPRQPNCCDRANQCSSSTPGVIMLLLAILALGGPIMIIAGGVLVTRKSTRTQAINRWNDALSASQPATFMNATAWVRPYGAAVDTQLNLTSSTVVITGDLSDVAPATSYELRNDVVATARNYAVTAGANPDAAASAQPFSVAVNQTWLSTDATITTELTCSQNVCTGGCVGMVGSCLISTVQAIYCSNGTFLRPSTTVNSDGLRCQLGSGCGSCITPARIAGICIPVSYDGTTGQYQRSATYLGCDYPFDDASALRLASRTGAVVASSMVPFSLLDEKDPYIALQLVSSGSGAFPAKDGNSPTAFALLASGAVVTVAAYCAIVVLCIYNRPGTAVFAVMAQFYPDGPPETPTTEDDSRTAFDGEETRNPQHDAVAGEPAFVPHPKHPEFLVKVAGEANDYPAADAYAKGFGYPVELVLKLQEFRRHRKTASGVTVTPATTHVGGLSVGAGSPLAMAGGGADGNVVYLDAAAVEKLQAAARAGQGATIAGSGAGPVSLSMADLNRGLIRLPGGPTPNGAFAYWVPPSARTAALLPPLSPAGQRLFHAGQRSAPATGLPPLATVGSPLLAEGLASTAHGAQPHKPVAHARPSGHAHELSLIDGLVAGDSRCLNGALPPAAAPRPLSAAALAASQCSLNVGADSADDSDDGNSSAGDAGLVVAISSPEGGVAIFIDAATAADDLKVPGVVGAVCPTPDGHAGATRVIERSNTAVGDGTYRVHVPPRSALQPSPPISGRREVGSVSFRIQPDSRINGSSAAPAVVPPAPSTRAAADAAANPHAAFGLGPLGEGDGALGLSPSRSVTPATPASRLSGATPASTKHGATYNDPFTDDESRREPFSQVRGRGGPLTPRRAYAAPTISSHARRASITPQSKPSTPSVRLSSSARAGAVAKSSATPTPRTSPGRRAAAISRDPFGPPVTGNVAVRGSGTAASSDPVRSPARGQRAKEPSR